MRSLGVCLVVLGLLVGGTAAAVEPGGATYILDHEPPSVVHVGDEVTEVLTATDDSGNGVPGLTVRFVRAGPSTEVDESCPADDLSSCAVTDAGGRAEYWFIAAASGSAAVTAEVYSPEGSLLDVAGPDQVTIAGTVICRGYCPISAKLRGDNKRGHDVLRVSAPRVARGAEVRLEKRLDGRWRGIGRLKRLDADGDRGFSVPDPNGRGVTRYRARVSPVAEFLADDITPVVLLR